MKKRPSYGLYRAMLLAVLAVLIALVTAAAGAAASTPGRPMPEFLKPLPAYQPGDQVWTTNESVPPPGAMAPFTPPDPVALNVIMEPVRPYQPGDKVWTSNDQVPPPAQPDANGCQYVPSTGYIGHNVYGTTTYEYSNYWYWDGSSSGEPFHWYIRRLSDDQALYDGHSDGGGGSQYTNANNWRWQVQNQGADPQRWHVCYEVL
jgi:hypothetical protein